MGHLRLSRNALAALVIAVGFTAIGTGGWMLWGHAWGLILAGSLTVVYAALLLVDVPEPPKRDGKREERR